MGFNIKTLPYELAEDNTFQLHLWDVGGQSSIRAYWRNYFEQTEGLIWVVDSTDRFRLEQCREELAKLLHHERLAGASLLILANKQDGDGALAKQEIVQALELDDNSAFSKQRHWSIVACSALTGEGLQEGLEWMVRDVADRIYWIG